MKNHLKIVIFIFIFAISNFIGLGKVRGVMVCNPSDPVCSNGGGISTEVTSPSLKDCNSTYLYCQINITTASRHYYVIEVYDIQTKSKMYYYDFNYGNVTTAILSDLSFTPHAYGNNVNNAERIDLKILLGSDFNRNKPDLSWSKWDNYVSNFAISNDGKPTASAGSEINNTAFNKWLYLNEAHGGRAGGKYDCLKENECTNSATAALKAAGKNGLYVVRISAGILISKMTQIKPEVNQIHMEHYVATDRLFNTEGPINTDVFDQATFIKPLKLYSTRNPIYSICTDGSSVKALCSYDSVHDSGFLDNAYWFTDGGNKIDPTINCANYCSTDGIAKYGSATECNKCCTNVGGQYVLDETSDKCSNIPTCLKPSSLPPESTYGSVKCGGTYNINFYENNGATICDGIPIYSHIVGSIEIPDGSITLLNNNGRLVSNPFAVAGKGFNWDTTFDGTLSSNSYVDPSIKNKYNQYLNCVINRNTQINSTITELKNQQKNVSGDAYNKYQTQINTLTNLLTKDAELTTIRSCNTKIQNFFNNPTSVAIRITNDNIQINKKHFDAVGYNIGQEAGDIKLIPKNFADPFSNYDDIKSFIKQKLDFFVPITIPNRTRGILSLSATIDNQYLRNSEKGQISIECPILISSYVDCQDDDKCTDDDDHYDDDDDDNRYGDDDDDTPPGGGGDDDDDVPCDPNDPNCDFFQCQDDDKCQDDDNIPFCVPNDPDCPFFTCDDPNGCTTGLNLIYRPVSLKDPFPNRTQGYNWEGTYNGKTYKEIFITKSRGANDNEIYQKEPMYVITLTPTDIRSIRQYNRTHSYNDFNLRCNSDGLECTSDFIRRNADYSYMFELGNCVNNNDWYACYSQDQKEATKKILNPMKW